MSFDEETAGFDGSFTQQCDALIRITDQAMMLSHRVPEHLRTTFGIQINACRIELEYVRSHSELPAKTCRKIIDLVLTKLHGYVDWITPKDQDGRFRNLDAEWIAL